MLTIDFSGQVDRRHLTPAAARWAVETEDRAALLDSLILCKFLRGVFPDVVAASAEMLQLVTGWDVTPDELRATARRIVDARKLFNQRAGWRPADDTLPDRFFDNPLPDDPQACLTREQLADAVRAYHRCRGWTSDGYLPSERLAALSEDIPPAATAR